MTDFVVAVAASMFLRQREKPHEIRLVADVADVAGILLKDINIKINK